MELTRRSFTNVAAPDGKRAPMGYFVECPEVSGSEWYRQERTRSRVMDTNGKVMTLVSGRTCSPLTDARELTTERPTERQHLRAAAARNTCGAAIAFIAIV